MCCAFYGAFYKVMQWQAYFLRQFDSLAAQVALGCKPPIATLGLDVPCLGDTTRTDKPVTTTAHFTFLRTWSPPKTPGRLDAGGLVEEV